jgi:hypothetical protein
VEPSMTGRKPVKAGHYVGSFNRSITVVGLAEDENEFVRRDVIGGRNKKEEYSRMNMRHFMQDKQYPTQRSCLSSILDLYYKFHASNTTTSIQSGS